MDDPALDEQAHRSALRGLRTINRLSKAKQPFLQSISAMCQRDGLDAVSILDIATGSGDLPIGLFQSLQARGIDTTVHGCDFSPLALDVARDRAREVGVPLQVHQLDVLNDPIPEVDVITCALFLHHLEETDVVRLLERLAVAARRMIVISDLCRSRSGLFLARVVPRLLTRSPIVHIDGVRSVQGALTPSELGSLCSQAGLTDVRIRRIFPARMLVEWQPKT